MRRTASRPGIPARLRLKLNAASLNKPPGRLWIQFPFTVKETSHERLVGPRTVVVGFRTIDQKIRDQIQFVVYGKAAAKGTPNDLRRRGICLQISFVREDFDITCLCGVRFIKIKSVDEQTEYPWSFGLQILEIDKAASRQLKELCIEAGKLQ